MENINSFHDLRQRAAVLCLEQNNPPETQEFLNNLARMDLESIQSQTDLWYLFIIKVKWNHMQTTRTTFQCEHDAHLALQLQKEHYEGIVEKGDGGWMYGECTDVSASYLKHRREVIYIFITHAGDFDVRMTCNFPRLFMSEDEQDTDNNQYGDEK